MRPQRRYGMLPWVMLITFLGMGFALLNTFYVSAVPCWTDGCKIFQTTLGNGISLWTLAAGAFALLFVAAFWGLVAFGYFFVTFMLIGDIILLLIMALIAPCGTCLMGAMFVGMAYITFRAAYNEKKYIKFSYRFGWLFLVWGVFFIINTANVAESAFKVWALPQTLETGATASQVRVFVSPSCTACKKLIDEMDTAEAERVDVYPVIENLEDLAVIKKLYALRQSSSKPFREDFAESLKVSSLPWHEYFEPKNILLLLRLWRNQAHVIEQGGILPRVEIQGIPRALIQNSANTRPSTISSDNTDKTSDLDSTILPIDLGVAEACEEGTATPCP